MLEERAGGAGGESDAETLEAASEEGAALIARVALVPGSGGVAGALVELWVAAPSPGSVVLLALPPVLQAGGAIPRSTESRNETTRVREAIGE
jgi:hypothetical protein